MLKAVLYFYIRYVRFFFQKDIGGKIISIIVPLYNDKSFILDTLKSIKKQSYKNIECIIVDDVSTDGSADIVEAFVENDNRFRLIRHDENRGVASARNTGIKHAIGDYITFIDADDIIFRHSLFYRALKLHHEDTEALIGVYCHGLYFKERSIGLVNFIKNKVPYLVDKKVYFPTWQGEYPFFVHGPLYKTCEVNKLGGFNGLYRSTEDYEFLYRVLRNGYYLKNTHYLGVAYRQTESSKLMNDWKNNVKRYYGIFSKIYHPENSDIFVRNTPYYFDQPNSFYAQRYIPLERHLKLLIASGEPSLKGFLSPFDTDKELSDKYLEAIVDNNFISAAKALF